MYLNQKALWAPVSVSAVNNPFGDIQNASPITIDVRRQEHVEEVRTADGALHHTNFIYYVSNDVRVDDKLDGNIVVSVYDMRTLGGKLRLRRAKTI